MPKALLRLATGTALTVLLLVNWAAAQTDASIETPAQEEQAAPPAAPVDEKAPPLPFHGIEGPGGGAITPMAYLVNPGKPECLWGKPAVAASILNGGGKDLQALTVSETLFGRVEFSYGIDRLGLGSLPRDIDTYTPFGNIEESGVWLHNFNVRTLLVKENDCLFGLKAPAITAGVSFKYNGQIENINDELQNALGSIGYRRDNGTDFTLTMTKTFPKLAFERPVIVTAGMRLSEAADIGFPWFRRSIPRDLRRQHRLSAVRSNCSGLRVPTET